MPIYVNFSSNGGKGFLKTRNSRVYGMSQGLKTLNPSNIDAIQFKFEVESPYDASTGHASGKRHHEPVTITKETDASSPSLFRLSCNHEAFETLNINFEQVDSKGLQQPYLAMNLTKVAIVGFKRKPHPGKASSKDVLELEEISFAFQKIEVVRKNRKSSMDDDWAVVGQVAEATSVTSRLMKKDEVSYCWIGKIRYHDATQYKKGALWSRF